MVKVLWHICMAWVIVLNSMVYSVICVNYQMNKAFISDYFCENREVPLSTCEGKCYLEKELEKASDREVPLIEFRADFNVFVPVTAFGYRGAVLSTPTTPRFLPYLDSPYTAALAREKKPPRI
ncbi:hypothetical protein [Cyclobacterium xiamenense]|uniref:hypothetical protein n=1 Tax=Cyclobacterium xiamenense TaxID=1297121 RepID=UPI0035CE8EE7